MSGAREQVTRLLALVPYLQNRQNRSLREIAEDFEVTPAQLRKDLSVLWMCGLPGLGPGDLIDLNFDAFENDVEGRVQIGNADYLTRPLRLGSTEASALVVALRTLRESGGDAPREVIDRVLAKLDAATSSSGPAPLAGHTVRVTAADVGASRTTLQEAIATDRQVRLDYYVPARDENTDRVVDPLTLVDRDGHAYLDAWCHLAEGRRLFRLDRIDGVEVLDRSRTRADEPPLELGEELFTPSDDDAQVVLEVRAAARWLVDFYPVESVRELDADSLEVTLRVADPRWLVQMVLGLAPDVQVLRPAEHAESVLRQARAALALYAD